MDVKIDFKSRRVLRNFVVSLVFGLALFTYMKLQDEPKSAEAVRSQKSATAASSLLIFVGILGTAMHFRERSKK